jgi:hypothetical protein
MATDDETTLDDTPLDAAAMLALSTGQQQRVSSQFVRPVVTMLGAWGVAWLIGFLALWLALEPQAPFSVPIGVAGPLFGILIGAAIVASIVIGARMSRGIRGSSVFSGAVYGWTWSIASFAVFLVGQALVNAGMPVELSMLYYPTTYGVVAGILYLAGAALWTDKTQLFLGLWIIVVSVASSFAGTPTNLLFMALLGGGGFLAGTVAVLVRGRVARRG